MTDLSTAAGVLEWAEGGVSVTPAGRVYREQPDDATAQRIADAVKLAEDPRTKRALAVLEALEEMEPMEGPFRNRGNPTLCLEEGTADGWNACMSTLLAARDCIGTAPKCQWCVDTGCRQCAALDEPKDT